MIHPTIGRRVWFFPGHQPRIPVDAIDPDQPMDAGIVFVHSDRMVNLDVCDHHGNHYGIQSVRLLQEGEDAPTSEEFAVWMPYQRAQAKQA